MEGKTPSLGYSLLAEIIQRTRHKVVVTTNFDNLVAEALAMHAHQSPLVIAHESLAGFVRPQLRRPLVAKIHRDLFFSPKNDTAGVSNMEEPWKNALKKLFQYFTPIIIGYGGNDGSLMGMLGSLDKGDIAGRMIWCYREGSPPSELVRKILIKHNGIQVKISGFDEFMLSLAAKLVKNFNITTISDRTEEIGQERAKIYREQTMKLLESSEKVVSQETTTSQVFDESIKTGNNWWAWLLKAKKEKNPDAADAIFKNAIARFPNNDELLRNYAIFLTDRRKDNDAAEAIFEKAISINKNNAKALGDYALFMFEERKDITTAEKIFQQALEIEPENTTNLNNYAFFLANGKNSLEDAKLLFRKILLIDPDDIDATINLAATMSNTGEVSAAKGLFIEAINKEPLNARVNHGYAAFLTEWEQNYKEAELFFEKAIELTPNNPNLLNDYAIFCDMHLSETDKSVSLLEKALSISPNNTTIMGTYAGILISNNRDLLLAQELLNKCMSSRKHEENNIANSMYLKIIINNELTIDEAEMMTKRVLDACNEIPAQALAEALFYTSIMQIKNDETSATNNLSKIKWLLDKGFPRGQWSFEKIFEKFESQMNENQMSLYKLIGDAIINKNSMNELNKTITWQTLPAINPFSDINK